MLRLLIFVMFLLVPLKCFGQEFFNYTLNKHLIFQKEIFTAELLFNVGTFSLNRFVIRPVISDAILQVCCDRLGNWTFADSLWTSLPYLDERVQLKLVSFLNPYVTKRNLYFEIMDTKTGFIYKTPEKPIWAGGFIYDNYVNKVNSWVSTKKDTLGSDDVNYKMLKLSNDQVQK